MKYEVIIDGQTYAVEAPNTYEAKVKAARQHFKASPDRFTSPNDILIKSKIEVSPVEGT